MIVTISDSEKFSKFSIIFNNMKNFTNTIVLNMNDEGLYTQGLDSGNVCLFECKINKDWFDNYQCDDESYNLGINTTMLNNILSIYENGQTFELVISKPDEENKTENLEVDSIVINYINNEKNKKYYES